MYKVIFHKSHFDVLQTIQVRTPPFPITLSASIRRGFDPTRKVILNGAEVFKANKYEDREPSLVKPSLIEEEAGPLTTTRLSLQALLLRGLQRDTIPPPFLCKSSLKRIYTKHPGFI
ncbi:unnamed protein product [Nezara viridula]|uniref:Uncharacterized protein n=1 Tax=Nezara viridula TaxID=85310 RepID=A0A9P0HQU0_NEZVI|nr:unnamed protein product [Nezara viridula]